MNRKWLNKSQPQALQYGVMLLYVTAAFDLLNGLLGGFDLLLLVLTALCVAGGMGIANDRKWGYYTGVNAAILPLAYLVYYTIQYGFSVLAAVGIFNLFFEVALAVALLAPSSREYQKIWFQ